MLPFKLIYSDAYFLPIGQHVFPAEKYRRIHDKLIESGVADAADFLTPQPASDQDILLVHKPQYVNKLKTGTLSAMEELQMEIPYSPELVNTFWLSAGGSSLAAMIHDVAVAIRRMQRDGNIRTAMTVDCDVHQGNGTAAIFAGMRTGSQVMSEPLPSSGPAVLGKKPLMRGAHAGDVFTISLHQENNYPPHKPPSSIDVDLPDGTTDGDYLAWLDHALSSGLRQFTPDLICYIAGADPYCEDQLGGLALTIEGLKKRDELVFRVARAKGIPVMVTYAGGYAQRVEDTVTIHCNTVAAAAEVFASPPAT
ncbi:MAG: histone deacetylase [Acidobacteria bacterium]|nr:MAG: histone deacetylase [Acidobacteriota bacterium]